jgi:EpsI family protein
VTRPASTSWILFALMAGAAACAWALAPTQRMADGRGKLALEEAIPAAFGEWRVNPVVAPVTVSPDVQAELDKIYDQILARTYVNGRGDMVMLSIAYGGTQNRSMQVHRPEVCYPAQGFQIEAAGKANLAAGATELPVMRLLARQGPRSEPITYWIRIGDKVVRGNVELGLARLAYGLGGRVPDGMLVRVSTISRDTDRAYEVQREFVAALLAALPPDTRALLVGTPS